MVSQVRSDWGDDWEWGSRELQDLWASLPSDERAKVHRGLLIDWGFAAVERVHRDEAQELTEDDVKVYRPTQKVTHSQTINVVSHENDTARHCISSNHISDMGEYGIPALWEVNEHNEIVDVGTHFTPPCAFDGHVNLELVNQVLGKDERHSLTNATVRYFQHSDNAWLTLLYKGTWPFTCLDVMTNWMTASPMIIQPWHDL